MRKLMHLSCAIVGVLATTVSAGPASAVGPSDVALSPPAEQIVIDVVTTNGSGCPPGSAAVKVGPANSYFAITYTSSYFRARLGGGAAPTDFRKNCQLAVILRVPPGFTYAINKTDHYGFASIMTGASAVQRANAYYKGQSQTSYTSYPFAGPMVQEWHTSTEVPPPNQVWSPCSVNRHLNLNTEVRVAPGTSDPRTTTSEIAMEASFYHLSWAQRCP